MDERATLLERRSPAPSVEAVAFLTRAEHRLRALEALAERPRTRDELQRLTAVSSSTTGRTLRAFEDRRWIERRGDAYEATALGAYVASGLADLVERLETERKLRDVWELLAPEAEGLEVEMLADATVTVAEPDDPNRPLNRFFALLEETDQFRFVGNELPLLEPRRDELCRRIRTGMETDIVDPPAVVRHVRSTYPEQTAETLASGNLTVSVLEDAPAYGLGLLDDRVVIAGYAPDSGALRVLIDTVAPAVREWAVATYEACRADARPLGAVPVQ